MSDPTPDGPVYSPWLAQAVGYVVLEYGTGWSEESLADVSEQFRKVANAASDAISCYMGLA